MAQSRLLGGGSALPGHRAAGKEPFSCRIRACRGAGVPVSSVKHTLALPLWVAEGSPCLCRACKGRSRLWPRFWSVGGHHHEAVPTDRTVAPVPPPQGRRRMLVPRGGPCLRPVFGLLESQGLEGPLSLACFLCPHGPLLAWGWDDTALKSELNSCSPALPPTRTPRLGGQPRGPGGSGGRAGRAGNTGAPAPRFQFQPHLDLC